MIGFVKHEILCFSEGLGETLNLKWGALKLQQLHRQALNSRGHQEVRPGARLGCGRFSSLGCCLSWRRRGQRLLGKRGRLGLEVSGPGCKVWGLSKLRAFLVAVEKNNVVAH